MSWHSLQLGQREVSIQASSDGGRSAAAGARRARPRRGGRRLGGGGRCAGLAAAAARSARLAGQQALGMRVVDAGVFLQPVPQQQAAPRRLHHPGVDEHAVQASLRVHRQQVGNAPAASASQRQPVGRRHHAGVPALARHGGEVRGVAAVAQREVGVGEVHGSTTRCRFSSAYSKGSAGQSSSGARLFSSEKRAAQLRAGRGVVGEGREGARLHRRGGLR